MIELNGYRITPTLFPDNTSQVWKLPEYILKDDSYIEWHFKNEAEIFQLYQLKCLLDSLNLKVKLLYIDYLPYARQDKEISNDLTFALIPFANLLNSFKFTNIFILDPHSLKAIEFINNSYPLYPFKRINKLIKELNINTICYPDNGANIKYSKEYDFKDLNIIVGDKQRDQSTGYITGYKFIGSIDNINDKDILIIDDICDGGATFNILSSQIKDFVKSINLFVTHGIFSKGLKELKEAGINRIFTNKGEAITVDKNTVGYIAYK